MKLLVLFFLVLSFDGHASYYVCGEQVDNQPDSEECMLKVHIPELYPNDPDPFAFFRFAQLCDALSSDSTRPLSERGFYPVYTNQERSYPYELRHEYSCEDVYKKSRRGRGRLVGKRCEVAFQVMRQSRVIHEGFESELCKKGNEKCLGLKGLMEKAIAGPYSCE